MLLNRRSPLWFWALPPAIYAIAMLPAWLAGWPAWDLLTVYVRQAEYVPSNGVSFVSTASNPWALFRFINYDLAIRSYWVGFLAASIATVSYIAYFASRRLSKDDMVAAAALSAAMLPFLLPGMHERFFVLAELCAFCWALAVRSREAIAVAALLQVQFVLSYFGWVLRRPELTIAGGILTTIALGLLVACSGRKRRIASSGKLSGLHG